MCKQNMSSSNKVNLSEGIYSEKTKDAKVLFAALKQTAIFMQQCNQFLTRDGLIKLFPTSLANASYEIQEKEISRFLDELFTVEDANEENQLTRDVKIEDLKDLCKMVLHFYFDYEALTLDA